MTQPKLTSLLAFILVMILSTNIFSQEVASEKISGVAYFDYTYYAKDDPTVNNVFDFSRVYFTYEKALSDVLNYRFQTDAERTDGGKLEVFLKNVNVSWKTGYGNVVIGLQGMNMFDVQEKTWGYRFIEKMSMDLGKYSSSADIAIGYNNSLTKDLYFSGLVSNGTGFKKAENDKYKKISAQLVYGDRNLSGKEGFNIGGVFSFEPYEYKNALNETSTENKNVIGLFGGYAGNNLRAGAEFNQFVTGGSDLTQSIISFYANYSIKDYVQIFGRFDNYDPDTDVKKNGNSYIIGGLVFTPTKGLTISPNIRYTTPEEGESQSVYKLNFEFKI